MNNTEFETKVLTFDREAVEKRLRELGAIEKPEFLARRYVFDIETENIEWIRLRESNGKVTLTYKHKIKGNVTISKTTEIEVEVSDFDKTAQILSKLPFRKTYYQENKSHVFRLGDMEFSIDTWPMMDPYLEIESTSLEKVNEGLRLLGLVGLDVGDKDIKDMYGDKGIDLHQFDELKFS